MFTREDRDNAGYRKQLLKVFNYVTSEFKIVFHHKTITECHFLKDKQEKLLEKKLNFSKRE